MKEELITFETAKLAKEKGYNKEFEDYPYKGCIIAPTQSLLQRWLREKHGIHVWVHPNLIWQTYHHKGIVDRKETHNTNIAFDGESMKDTYEEALEVGLQEALKLIK